MSGVLAVFVLGYAGFLGCWALAASVAGARLGVGYLVGLALLELTLLVRAAAEAAALAGARGGFGRGYAEPAVHLAYVLASVAVLPLVLAVTRPFAVSRPLGGAAPGRRWDALVAAVACAAVVIVTVRVTVTARPA